MPTPSIARQSRAAGWWVGALVIALAVMATSFGSPKSVPDAGPTAYLPADGFRTRFTGPTGALATEWAVDQAAQLVNPGPAHFGYWLSESGLSFTDTLAARKSTVYTNAAGVVVNREDTFMAVGPDGIGTGVEVRSWTDSRFYFPARLDLPTSLAAGKSWAADGKARVFTKSGETQDTTYHAEYQATAPTSHDEQVRRCIHITMTLQVGTATEPAATRTWCPKLGVTTVVESDGTWQATTDNATIAPPTEAGFDWAAVDRLTFTPHTINQAAVPGSVLAAPISAPAILSNGTVVAVQKQFHDTVGLSTQTEPIRSIWRTRPGGTATSTATFGDLTLVATSARQLIAYDLFGRWIWQAPLPDQSVVSPVRVGNVAVVATLDGSLTAIDLTNGSVAWTRRVTDSIRLQPQALNDRVVVSDLSQQLTCFGADGTRLWTRDALAVSNFAIGPGTAPVVVIGDGRQATGISLADGSTLWQTPLRMSLVSMVALDGVVAVRDGNLTTGLDTASGTTEWRWDQARTYAGIGHGDRLLLLADKRLVALDAHGRQLKEWPLAVTNLGAGEVMLSTGTDRLLIWTSGAVLQGVIG